MRTTRLTAATVVAFLASVAALHGSDVYFPHYGDGGGLSMLFSVTNPTGSPARARISFYDPLGNLQRLPFAAGTRSSFDFNLAPHGSRTFRTLGSSDPIQSGYAIVESDNDQVSGVAVFQFSFGAEASVLSTGKTRRRSLFAERSATFETGLAVLRSSPGQEITATLYDSAGRRLRSGELIFQGMQGAGFLRDIFSNLSSRFEGVLVLESTEEFSSVGLRFGNGLLSTAPFNGFSPFGLAQIEILAEPSGLWFFEYTISSTVFDQTYAIYQAADLSTNDEPDDFRGLGVDEFGDPVVAIFDSALESLVMLDQSAILDRLFVFHFDSEDEIGGCYYQVSSDGEISDCFQLTGLRFDARKFLTGFAGESQGRSSAPQEFDDIEERRAVSRFSTPSPSMANVIEKLRRLSARATGKASSPE